MAKGGSTAGKAETAAWYSGMPGRGAEPGHRIHPPSVSRSRSHVTTRSANLHVAVVEIRVFQVTLMVAGHAGRQRSHADGRRLLDLGVDVKALHEEGDGYYDVARNSTALHNAAWRARHQAVKLLLERGASVKALDGQGRTPLALAVRACVDSYWTERRSPESVEALLDAGASVEGVPFPCGYAEVDELLRRQGGA